MAFSPHAQRMVVSGEICVASFLLSHSWYGRLRYGIHVHILTGGGLHFMKEECVDFAGKTRVKVLPHVKVQYPLAEVKYIVATLPFLSLDAKLCRNVKLGQSTYLVSLCSAVSMKGKFVGFTGKTRVTASSHVKVQCHMVTEVNAMSLPYFSRLLDLNDMKTGRNRTKSRKWT